jgi:hypothetical protein
MVNKLSTGKILAVLFCLSLIVLSLIFLHYISPSQEAVQRPESTNTETSPSKVGNTDDADKYISLLEMTLNECRIDFQKRLPELSVILEYRFAIEIIVESPFGDVRVPANSSKLLVHVEKTNVSTFLVEFTLKFDEAVLLENHSMVLLPQSISTRKAVLQYVPGKGYYLPNGKYLGNFFPMFEVENLQASFIYAKKGEWPTLDNDLKTLRLEKVDTVIADLKNKIIVSRLGNTSTILSPANETLGPRIVAYLENISKTSLPVRRLTSCPSIYAVEHYHSSEAPVMLLTINLPTGIPTFLYSTGCPRIIPSTKVTWNNQEQDYYLHSPLACLLGIRSLDFAVELENIYP